MRALLVALVLVSTATSGHACIGPPKPPGAVLDAMLPGVKLDPEQRRLAVAERARITALLARRLQTFSPDVDRALLQEAWAIEERTLLALGFRKVVDASDGPAFRCGGGSAKWVRATS